MEPEVSVPIAREAKLAAMAAPEPALEPPVESSGRPSLPGWATGL